ncbi:hypothetical protein F3Y22_tig00113124pilonHSYRG00511 [Hibiscus syriacus]|uniref:Uncharacterized protein n=1 Tax=Hibiscus syriacus TaxID=106335 RepID=A0A6A2XLU2_HIBSY|nr:hypothetical protein F3Y22_tig00113124pilonHSYRG00511 [Hibiscus syriacus]
MASSKKRATSISSIASLMYFLLIIFQIPLFRTPIEITSSQLIATELFPTHVVKVLLYPGAIVNGVIKNKTLPSYSKLLSLYNSPSSRKSTAVSDLQRLEIVAGSYLSVVGAFVGLSRRGRMSLFGTMLIIWGFLRENILGQFQCMFRTESIRMFPTLMVAVVCAFLSIKKDTTKSTMSEDKKGYFLKANVQGESKNNDKGEGKITCAVKQGRKESISSRFILPMRLFPQPYLSVYFDLVCLCTDGFEWKSQVWACIAIDMNVLHTRE